MNPAPASPLCRLWDLAFDKLHLWPSDRMRKWSFMNDAETLWTMGDIMTAVPTPGMTIIDRIPWTVDVVDLSHAVLATDAQTMIVVSKTSCRADVITAANSASRRDAEHGLNQTVSKSASSGMLNKGEPASILDALAGETPCDCVGTPAQSACSACRRTGIRFQNVQINGQTFSGRTASLFARWGGVYIRAARPVDFAPQPFFFPGGLGFAMPLTNPK